MVEEGVAFRYAIVQGSVERRSPILMTAFVTGVCLIPLALGALATRARRFSNPMAVVILGGIVTSTYLNMFVVPALYLKFGRADAHAPVRDVPRGRQLSTAWD